MCKGKRNEPDLITILFFLFTIIAIIAVIYVMSRLDCLDDSELAYSFIGIIATFVVVGNFAQMVEMRNETNKKLNEARNKLEMIEKYYEDTIINRIVYVLNKNKVDFPFVLKPNSIISIRHKVEKTYLTEVRMVKREEQKIITGEHQTVFFEVDLGNETYSMITKENLERDNN